MRWLGSASVSLAANPTGQLGSPSDPWVKYVRLDAGLDPATEYAAAEVSPDVRDFPGVPSPDGDVHPAAGASGILVLVGEGPAKVGNPPVVYSPAFAQVQNQTPYPRTVTIIVYAQTK